MIQSVDRALRLLAEIRNQSGSTLTALSERLGLLPSTASRLLSTLEGHGLVERDAATKAYRLGPAARALGRAADGTPDPVELLEPIVHELADTVGEQVSLAALDGPHVVHVIAVDGAAAAGEQVVLAACSGRRDSNLNATALGKVFLAHLPPRRAEAIIAGLDFAKTAPRTITCASELRRHLDRVRRNGYAFSLDENTEHVRGVAAPVFGSDGTIAFGLAVHGPTIRLSRARLRELVPHVRDAARACSTTLGHSGPAGQPTQRPG